MSVSWLIQNYAQASVLAGLKGIPFFQALTCVSFNLSVLQLFMDAMRACTGRVRRLFGFGVSPQTQFYKMNINDLEAT